MSTEKNIKIDDFWNDCLSDIYKKPKLNKTLNANKKNKKQNVKPIKTFFKDSKSVYESKMKSFTESTSINEKSYSKIALKQMAKNNRKLIKEALIKEDLIPILENQKKEKIIQKFIDIYNKDKISKDLYYKNIDKQKLNKEKLKQEECTFKPQKCINKHLEKKINRKFDGTNIYERTLKYKQKHNEKVAFLFNEISKINNNYKSSQCFFQPTILNTNVEKILYNPNNIWKEQADNDSNKLFLLRYIKARDEEFYKKEKLNNSVNKKLKTSLTQPKKMARAISQKDSLVYKKNLHNILYSLGNLLVDEEDETENNKEEEKKLEENNNNKKNINNFQWTFSKKNENYLVLV